jgi:hypothetical protein
MSSLIVSLILGCSMSRKGTAEPRWGWSGANIVCEPSENKDRLFSAVALLPSTNTSIDQIVDQLLALGGRYHRYLHQDEFGPWRAEQLAALRDVIQTLNQLISQLADLTDSARETLCRCLANPTLCTIPIPSAHS